MMVQFLQHGVHTGRSRCLTSSDVLFPNGKSGRRHERTTLGPALSATRAGLALRTSAIARIAAVPAGALALPDDAVRVRRVVLAATGLEAAGQEGVL
jgi:hypothetical protein